MTILPSPKCPKCGTPRLRVNKTIRDDDGDTVRYFICLDAECGHGFKVTFTTNYESVQIFRHMEGI